MKDKQVILGKFYYPNVDVSTIWEAEIVDNALELTRIDTRTQERNSMFIPDDVLPILLDLLTEKE